MNNCNKSYEPMDVDLSANSITGMDISYNDLDTHCDFVLDKKENANETLIFEPNSIALDSNTDQPRCIKVYHINKKTENGFTSISIVLPFIAVMCISIFIYQVLNVECNNELNKDYIKEKLHNKLYGQHSAINDIISTIGNDAKSKILFFYGGTGVGKTYTLSLLLENAWNYSNIYHYTMPYFMDTFSTDMMVGLTICKTAMFIVDDLTFNDVENIKSHVKKIILKSEGLKKTITIILVFNCHSGIKDYMTTCDDSLKDTVLNTFADINVLKQFIKFQPLSIQHLKMCISDELKGKNIDKNVLKHILKNFNVSTDGCKGVHQKIKYLNFA